MRPSFPRTVNEKAAFGLLMRAGIVPDDVCAECADIWSRPGMVRPPAT